MQISPDPNTRIAQIKPFGRIPVSERSAAGLTDGDILAATVARVQREAVLLRFHGGALLRAALSGDMRLSEGDVIEAAVSKSGSTCFLYILNVSRSEAQPAQEGVTVPATPQDLATMLSMLKRNPALDADTVQFLAENHIPDTAENIAALTQMSQGTGIGVLLGRILGLMAQPEGTALPGGPQAADTAPGQEAVPTPRGEAHQGTAMAVNKTGRPPAVTVQGQSSGEDQTAAFRTAASQTGATVLPRTADPGTDMGGAQPQGMGADMGVTQTQGTGADMGVTQPQGMGENMSDMQAQGAPIAQTGTQSGQESAPGSAAQAPPPEGVHRQSEPSPGSPQRAGENPGTQPMQSAQQSPAQEAPPGEKGAQGHPVTPGATEADPVAAPDAAVESDKRIGQMVRGLFFQPDEQAGPEMKKNAEELAHALKTLKSELVQSDIKNVEFCLKSADQALKQVELADMAMRFEHMQLPVAFRDGEYRTAELFVFRRQGGQKNAGEAGFSILVALDTRHIGRVETLIRETEGNVSLEFRLEKPELTAAFKQNSPSLNQAVEAAGYRLSGMRFAGLEKKTTVLNAGEMLEAGNAPPGIDVQI